VDNWHDANTGRKAGLRRVKTMCRSAAPCGFLFVASFFCEPVCLAGRKATVGILRDRR